MSDNYSNKPKQPSSALNKTPDIYPVFDQIISREKKEERLNQQAIVIWFTGLSGSGKTTLAVALEKLLFEKGFMTQILDGDNIRTGINNNLGFSPDDRTENIRRIAEVSKLFLNCGIITLCAFVSPTNEMRQMVKTIVGEENFYEVYVSTPVEVCEQRDVKGLYAKARAGNIKDFTGVSAPFEAPTNPDISIDTSIHSLNDCVEVLLEQILPKISNS